MRWTLVDKMNKMDYNLKEMNEMGYGLKEIKMKCDQWSWQCDKREVDVGDFVMICCKPTTEQIL